MDMLNFSLVLDHWSFVVMALAIAVAGEVIKRLIIPKGNPSKLPGWRGVYRVTLPLHPLLVGFLVGLLFPLPLPETVGTTAMARAMYYLGAGVVSGHAYNALRHFTAAYRS